MHKLNFAQGHQKNQQVSLGKEGQQIRATAVNNFLGKFKSTCVLLHKLQNVTRMNTGQGK